ncbi:hypothetical protein RFI_01544, partial [Reticulomyxa filosa]
MSIPFYSQCTDKEACSIVPRNLINDFEHSPLTLQNELVKDKTLGQRVSNVVEALPENKLPELDGLEEDKENAAPKGLSLTSEAKSVKTSGIRSFPTSCKQDLEKQLVIRLLDLEKSVASQAMENPYDTKVVVAGHVCADKDSSDNSTIQNEQLVRTIERLNYTLKQRKRSDAEEKIEKMGLKSKYLDSHGLLEIRPLGKIVAGQKPSEFKHSKISKGKRWVQNVDNSGEVPPDIKHPRSNRRENEEESALKVPEKPVETGFEMASQDCANKERGTHANYRIGRAQKLTSEPNQEILVGRGKGVEIEKLAQDGRDLDPHVKLVKKIDSDRKLAKKSQSSGKTPDRKMAPFQDISATIINNEIQCRSGISMASGYNLSSSSNFSKVKAKSDHEHNVSNGQTNTGKLETKGNPKWFSPNEEFQQVIAAPPLPPQREINRTSLTDNLEGHAQRQQRSPLQAMQYHPLSPYSKGQCFSKPASTAEAGNCFSGHSPLWRTPLSGGQTQASPCDKSFLIGQSLTAGPLDFPVELETLSKGQMEPEHQNIGSMVKLEMESERVTKCGGRQTAMQMTQFDPPCDILKQMHCPSSIVLPRRIADGPNHPSSSPPPTTQVTTKQPQLLQLAEQQVRPMNISKSSIGELNMRPSGNSIRSNAYILKPPTTSSDELNKRPSESDIRSNTYISKAPKSSSSESNTRPSENGIRNNAYTVDAAERKVEDARENQQLYYREQPNLQL